MAKAAVEESTSPTLTPFPPSLISPLLAQYLPSTSILNPSPTPIPSVADLHAVRAELLKYKDRLKERFRTTELNEIALRNYKVGNVNGQSTNVPNLTTPSNIPIIKSKGKEKERSSSVTPIPTSVPLNSIAPVTSHPLIKSNSKQARANSELTAGASSPEGSDGDSFTSAPKLKKRKFEEEKKRKRKRENQVIDSDHDYSESETPLANTATNILKLESRASSIPILENKEKIPTPQSESRAGSQGPSLTLKLKLNDANTTPVNKPTKTPSILIEPTPAAPVPIVRKGPPNPGVADDFSLPVRSLVPPKPVSIPPNPTPRQQSEVEEDFSKAKPTTQTPFASFAASVEPYLRAYGDDDLAFLASKNEDLSPFLIPALGRHYSEVWQEEDIALGLIPAPSVPLAPAASPLEFPPLERILPERLSDEDLATENIFSGPLTERLTASLNLSALPGLANSLTQSEDNTIGTSANMDSVDLEDRIRRELNYLGVFPWEPPNVLNGPLSSASKTPVLGSGNLGSNVMNRHGEIDWSLRTDDEISAALRACQRQLRDQMNVNENRKIKLAEIVRDRLAYQEFETLRDALEKQIETGWIRRQRHHGKRKVKGKGVEKVPPIELLRSSLPEGLVSALEKRRRLVDSVAPLFQHAEAGQFRGLPTNRVFEEEIQVKREEI